MAGRTAYELTAAPASAIPKPSAAVRSKALLGGPHGLPTPPRRPSTVTAATAATGASAFVPVAPKGAPPVPAVERAPSSNDDDDARWLGSLDPGSTPSRKVRRQSGIKE